MARKHNPLDPLAFDARGNLIALWRAFEALGMCDDGQADDRFDDEDLYEPEDRAEFARKQQAAALARLMLEPLAPVIKKADKP